MCKVLFFIKSLLCFTSWRITFSYCCFLASIGALTSIRACPPLCTLPLHALLHVPQDIHNTGPISGCWSWVMERLCGVLGSAVQKGHRFPYAALSNHIYQHALINFFENQYNVGLKIIFAAKWCNIHADNELTDEGRIIGSEHSHCIPLQYSDTLYSKPKVVLRG